MTRKQKIEALQKVFETGNKEYLQETDKTVIHTLIIERDGWYQIVPITPTFEVPDHELTLKEFEEWKGCIPLFPDLNNFKKLDLSTWTNEQLESRLLELNNKENAEN